jgi:hypothetical protein
VTGFPVEFLERLAELEGCVGSAPQDAQRPYSDRRRTKAASEGTACRAVPHAARPGNVRPRDSPVGGSFSRAPDQLGKEQRATYSLYPRRRQAPS